MSNMTINEVVEKLSFPVSLRPAMFVDKDGVVRKGAGQQVVREDNNKALSFVSDTYGLIPHGSVFTPVVQALDGMEFSFKRFLSDGDGRRVLVHAVSKQEWEIAPNDKVKISLLLANSYDRAQAFKAVLGAFRLVCSNGMVVPHPAFAGLNVNVRIIHSKHQTRKLDVVALGNSLAQIYGAMEKQAAQWREWNQTEIKRSALTDLQKNVLEPVVGVRALPSVVSRIMGGRGQDGRLTLWSVFNGITEHYTDKGNASKTPVAGTLSGLGKQTILVERLRDWTQQNQNVLVAA